MPSVNELFEEHVLVEPVLEALRADVSLSDQQRATALNLVHSRGEYATPNLESFARDGWGRFQDPGKNASSDPLLRIAIARRLVELRPDRKDDRTHLNSLEKAFAFSQANDLAGLGMPLAFSSVGDLNSFAWDLVDPDREDRDTDVVLALRLTRKAIELAPEDDALRDTHAWALFANGLYDEALVESAKALELAGEANKDGYQGYLDRMRAMVEEARSEPPTSDLPGDDQ